MTVCPDKLCGRPVWLDIARLAERAVAGSLTGIDRVELDYAETLMALAPARTRFVMLDRLGRLVMLPQDAALRFLAAIRLAWRDGDAGDCRLPALCLLARAAMSPPARAEWPDRAPLYLLVSHRHLHRRAALKAALRRTGAAFVPMIHDLIPLEFPEYARPGEFRRHQLRLRTVAELADGVVTNSVATATSLVPHLPRGMQVHAEPLAVSLADLSEDGACAASGRSVSGPAPGFSPDPSKRPYFLCIGTIEPRKNHLLLLHLWRRLIARDAANAPQLILAGRRGWENENILDLLDRCPALRSHVIEAGSLPDSRLVALLRGARALLLPSFAEGFGLPVAESLALGVPVLCSDLPALHEAGGDAPEYLDPLDGKAWEGAVLDYACPGPRHAAAIARIASWRGVGREDHVRSVLHFAEQCGARPHPKRFIRENLKVALDSRLQPHYR